MIPDEDTKQRPVVTDLGGATALSYRKARNIAARLYNPRCNQILLSAPHAANLPSPV
jgi:hypothetical protein